jgi:hypothetical protein
MRAFVRHRRLLAASKDLTHKLNDLEKKYRNTIKKFRIVFDAIRELMATPFKPRRKIGFGGKY